MKTDLLRQLSMLAAILMLAGSVAACGDDDGSSGDDDDDDDDMMMDGGQDPMDGGEEPTGDIRILHLSPSTGAVDLYVDGDLSAVTGVTFPASTDFIPLPAADYDFDVAPAGTSVDDAVISVPGFTIAADASYTVVAYGSIDADTLPVLPIVENFDGLAAGSIRLNVVHVAEGIPTVDVWAGEVGGDGVELIDELDYGDSSFADVPTALITGDTVPVLLDAGPDGTADATFDVPASLLTGGDLFFNVYAVNDEGPVLYAQTENNSQLAGPIAPTP